MGEHPAGAAGSSLLGLLAMAGKYRERRCPEPTITTNLTDPEATHSPITTYDADGRIHSASNPYRTTNDPSYGLTTYACHAMGRATQITRPDNNVATMCHYGLKSSTPMS